MAKAKFWGEPNEEEMEKKVVAIMCPGCETEHIIYTKSLFEKCPVWSFNNDMEKPTFSPSLLVRTGKYVPGHEDFDDEGYNFSSICHSFINNGMIQFLDDCTHKLKGQTVELPNIKING